MHAKNILFISIKKQVSTNTINFLTCLLHIDKTKNFLKIL
jgi:hypothetical protein